MLFLYLIIIEPPPPPPTVDLNFDTKFSSIFAYAPLAATFPLIFMLLTVTITTIPPPVPDLPNCDIESF